MSEKDDAVQVLQEFVETNGEQAGRLAQATLSLNQVIESTVANFGEGAQWIIGPVEQARTYLTNAQAMVAQLGSDIESAVEFIEGLGQPYGT